MSHLACSDVPSHPLNALQLERFRGVRDLVPDVRASLANSAGIYLGREYHFDMVRPGIALYGGAITATRTLEVVVTLEAQVLQVRDAKAGESVGYSATQTLTAPTRLAILGVGYADGYHRASSPLPGKPGPRVMLHGQSAAVVGRVSMDLIAVDVTAIPGVKRGDWAELFGRNIPVDETAVTAGTIGYEFLTGLGNRYARRHNGGPKGLQPL
jgi:alanine racemase